MRLQFVTVRIYCSQQGEWGRMSETTSIDRDRARRELDAIIASQIFDRAPNLATLLRYVCGKYLEGKADEIKEYNIAVEAFGRPPDFDKRRDSIVRVEAHRLRKRLLQYYEAEEGRTHEVRLDIPPGQYVPRFVVQNARVEVAAPEVVVPEVLPGP